MMICQTSKKTQKTKWTGSVCTACISLLPGPESSPPAQTSPHLPPDPGSLHQEKASRALPMVSVKSVNH